MNSNATSSPSSSSSSKPSVQKQARTRGGDALVFQYSAAYDVCLDLVRHFLNPENCIMFDNKEVRVKKKKHTNALHIFTSYENRSSFSVGSRFAETLHLKVAGQQKFKSESTRRVHERFLEAFEASNRDKNWCVVRLKAVVADDAFGNVQVNDPTCPFYLEDDHDNFVFMSMSYWLPLRAIRYDLERQVKLQSLVVDVMCDDSGVVKRIPQRGNHTELKIPNDTGKIGGFRSFYVPTADLPDADTLVCAYKTGKKYQNIFIVALEKPGKFLCVIGRSKKPAPMKQQKQKTDKINKTAADTTTVAAAPTAAAVAAPPVTAPIADKTGAAVKKNDKTDEQQLRIDNNNNNNKKKNEMQYINKRKQVSDDDDDDDDNDEVEDDRALKNHNNKKRIKKIRVLPPIVEKLLIGGSARH
ncbi:hypothetical protein ElyMa_003967300 [Elysia marginata]|uniref:Uncharacterized protein n=1 Tax=Elysia marginata TaxID=1093978 RepID=A0AAV4FVL8_9GAST|nr:hypothetical protein ElyMa_003967300 [Elysia marginata]